MKRVGIDTGVVLRLLTGEPADQAERAKRLVEQSYCSGVAVCVSDLVVAEAYHALVHHYDVPKLTAVHALRDLLSSPMVTTTGHALSVVGEYRGVGAGFVDRLIRMDALDHAHELRTFDRGFAELANVTLIE